jgi:uncharacterized membrane protein YfcA
MGGGGLLVVPLLLWLGLPPHNAIAIHRFATLFGGLSSLWVFLRSGKIIWQLVLPLIVARMIGNYIGTGWFLDLSADQLNSFIAFILMLLLPFLWLKKTGIEPRKLPKWMIISGVVIYFIISVLGGISSVGTATLALYALVLFTGMTFLEATATQKIPASLSRVMVLVILIQHDLVTWLYALPLAAGYLFGAYWGAHHAIKKGNHWLRGLLIVVVLSTTIKLLFF